MYHEYKLKRLNEDRKLKTQREPMQISIHMNKLIIISG